MACLSGAVISPIVTILSMSITNRQQRSIAQAAAKVVYRVKRVDMAKRFIVVIVTLNVSTSSIMNLWQANVKDATIRC